MRRVFGPLLLMLLGFWSTCAPAHEMTIAELELRESAKGEFLWTWASNERPVAEEISVHWPDACTAGEAFVHCGEAGLRGTLSVAGIGNSFSAAIVKVYWLDGQS